jgi:MFS family permease
MLAFSRQQAYSASLAPDAMRGRYVGFLSLAWCAGNTMSAAFGMAIYGKDPAAAWIVNALLGFGAASVILATGRKRDKDPVEIVAESQRGRST